jgi:pimeloyl-ACP methyl ester carboxylesterase
MPIFQLLKDKYTSEKLPYHVIVPSLPGYTFSSGPPLDKDFGVQDAARILDRLMSMLGFGDGYVVQGGDIGSRAARILATDYPSCKGRRPTAPNRRIGEMDALTVSSSPSKFSRARYATKSPCLSVLPCRFPRRVINSP